jgi:23S rRNA pseudouridine1911/1915/1917 synthase
LIEHKIGERVERNGIVHRIDKETSGILLVAKTKEAMKFLQNEFKERMVLKTYVTLVHGKMISKEGNIDAPISRNPFNKTKFGVFVGGKESQTSYKVKATYKRGNQEFSYLEVFPKTGRTHQIRVHMKYLGHTLFNDERYGGNKILKGTVYSKYKQFVDNCFRLLPRQALHAKTLGFIHPKSKEKISFNSDIPEDIASVIDKWRLYSKHKNL